MVWLAACQAFRRTLDEVVLGRQDDGPVADMLFVSMISSGQFSIVNLFCVVDR